MRLEWIDDILAVLDCGSLARAAEKRLLTQSAFTRRVRLIEDSVGATLFDRRSKPVTLMAGVKSLEPELRELSARLHKMRRALQTKSDQSAQSVSVVCQHALTTTISPQIVRALTKQSGSSARVRSGNQDECLMQLISKEVDFAVMYALPEDVSTEPGNAFETFSLGTDVLIPVATPRLLEQASHKPLPAITYPSDVFLGQVFARNISPRLPDDAAISTIAETALTLAMLQLALTDIGIAWLPRSLVSAHLAQGELIELGESYPAQPLTVRMLRLRGTHSQQADRIWSDLGQTLRLPTSKN